MLAASFVISCWVLNNDTQACICSGVCSFCWNFSERQILWSLCSVDFHTLTLQLPIQTLHSVAPELQVFVSSLKFSVKRAHPRIICFIISKVLTQGNCWIWYVQHWNNDSFVTSCLDTNITRTTNFSSSA